MPGGQRLSSAMHGRGGAREVRRRGDPPAADLPADRAAHAGADLGRHRPSRLRLPTACRPTSTRRPSRTLTQGRTRQRRHPRDRREMRGAGEGEGLSIRETVIEASGRQSFVGHAARSTPSSTEFARRRRRLHPRTASDPEAGWTSSCTRWCRCCRSAGVPYRVQGTTLRPHLGSANRYGRVDPASDAFDEWKKWHEHRAQTVSALLWTASLAHRYALAGGPCDGPIPHTPDLVADGDALLLRAAEEDGLTVDGRPFGGAVRLSAPTLAAGASRVAYGERAAGRAGARGSVGRTGSWPGVRGARAFRGIAATPHEPRWSVPGHFPTYDERRNVGMENATPTARSRAGRRAGVHPGRTGVHLQVRSRRMARCGRFSAMRRAGFAATASGSGDPPHPTPRAHDGRPQPRAAAAVLADHFILPLPAPAICQVLSRRGERNFLA